MVLEKPPQRCELDELVLRKAGIRNRSLKGWGFKFAYMLGLLNIDFKKAECEIDPTYREKAIEVLEEKLGVKGKKGFIKRSESFKPMVGYRVWNGLKCISFKVQYWASGYFEEHYVDEEYHIDWGPTGKYYFDYEAHLIAEVEELVPFELIKAFCEGKHDTGNCKLKSAGGDVWIWNVRGRELKIHKKLIEFVIEELCPNPVKSLIEHKLLDKGSFVASVLKEEWARTVEATVEVKRKQRVKVRKSFLKKLKILKKFEGETRTYKEWARKIGFKDKSGAYRFMKKAVESGHIAVEKTGKGVKLLKVEIQPCEAKGGT